MLSEGRGVTERRLTARDVLYADRSGPDGGVGAESPVGSVCEGGNDESSVFGRAPGFWVE